MSWWHMSWAHQQDYHHSLTLLCKVQALHALAAANPVLCMMPEDPTKLVRSLGPYLKASMAGNRQDAEALLCILAILTAVLGTVSQVEESVVTDLEIDLVHLIDRHIYTNVWTRPQY